MALTTFLRFGSRRPKATTDAFDILGDLVPWQESVDANAAKLPSLGFRNQLRNGDLGIRQRGGGAFTVTGVYTADGWIKSHIGGTHSINAADLSPSNAVGSRGYLASGVASQAAVGDYATLAQKIEGVRTFAGQQVTLSFVAAAAAGIKVGVEVTQTFGTGGTPSADVNTAVSAVTLTATDARYSVTFTVPSIAGKTLGTSGTDSLVLSLWLSAGANFATRASGIGIQNATINLWDLQLEAGPDASPFERLPLSEQTSWCQRYYVRSPGFRVAGFANSTSQAQVSLQFPVTMRAIPTVTTAAAAWLIEFLATSALSNAAISVGGATLEGFRAQVPTTAVLTAGQGVHVTPNGGYYEASAEL